jgi:hypothetical protein
MRRILILITLSCVAFPSFAAENEFRLGVSTASRYTDNVSNVSEGKVDAFAFDIGPRLQFDSSSTQYEAGMSYIPRLTFYTDERDDDVNHSFGAHADYRATKRLSFQTRDTLRLEFDADRDLTDFDEPSRDSDGDKQTFRNRFTFDTRYAATPRFSLDGNFGNFFVERKDKDLSDSNQFSGRIQGEYVLSFQDSIGAGVFARNQKVQGRIDSNGNDVGDSTTDFDGFFLSWSHRFTPLLSANAAGGPTWVTSNRDNDGRSSTTDLEYFANAGVNADFDHGKVSMTYSRSSAENARTSTTSLIDTVNLRGSMLVNRKVTLGVSGEWNLRKAILEQEGIDLEDNVEQWIFRATLSYKLTTELTSHFSVDYLRQDTDVDKPSDRIRAVIRLDYTARTFRF